MRIVKLDDYQSWYLHLGDARLLIDPWLTEAMEFPLGMFHRAREAGDTEALRPTHLILTAPFGDHLHPPSLQQLDKSIPALALPTPAKLLRKLGFTQVKQVRAGEIEALGHNVSVTFVAPGFPYSRSSVGLLLEERPPERRATRAYLETHVVSEAALQSLPKPIDALLTTAETVRLFGIQLAMDTERAARVAELLQARHFAPTGVNPGKSTGLLPRLLYVRSDRDALAAALARRGLSTLAKWLAPGEFLEVTN